MVEKVQERDILNQVRHLFVGDDTGLLKKVKLTAKKTAKEISVEYGGEREITKRRKLSDGEIEVTKVKRGPGKLSEEDN